MLCRLAISLPTHLHGSRSIILGLVPVIREPKAAESSYIETFIDQINHSQPFQESRVLFLFHRNLTAPFLVLYAAFFIIKVIIEVIFSATSEKEHELYLSS